MEGEEKQALQTPWAGDMDDLSLLLPGHEGPQRLGGQGLNRHERRVKEDPKGRLGNVKHTIQREAIPSHTTGSWGRFKLAAFKGAGL